MTEWENYKTEYEAKSKSYQYKFGEVLADPHSFIFINAVENKISPEINELRGQISDILIQEVNDKLTETQKKVLYLYLAGHSQSEIAKKLNIIQPTVNFHLFGLRIYKDGKKGKTIHGGIMKKLRTIANNNQEVNDLLKKISNLTEDGNYV